MSDCLLFVLDSLIWLVYFSALSSFWICYSWNHCKRNGHCSLHQLILCPSVLLLLPRFAFMLVLHQLHPIMKLQTKSIEPRWFHPLDPFLSLSSYSSASISRTVCLFAHLHIVSTSFKIQLVRITFPISKKSEIPNWKARITFPFLSLFIVAILQSWSHGVHKQMLIICNFHIPCSTLALSLLILIWSLVRLRLWFL